MNWSGLLELPERNFTCGFCGKFVASKEGYFAGREVTKQIFIYICPGCSKPSYFEGETQTPGVAPGAEIDHLPEDVSKLYKEARNCAAVGSYTSAVLSCRKILMHIAVDKGGKENQGFLAYVDYLAGEGYLPPNGKGWVDYIRKKGNEANHEIVLLSKEDAEGLLAFLEMLLKFIYEFPKRIPQKPETS